jgi:3-oxoacyl-[acyl-carrier-protein] synthase III
MLTSIISGTGAYIPENIQSNDDFYSSIFFEEKGSPITHSSETIIEKFSKITGIRERRYVTPEVNASDIAAEAGRLAIEDSGIDPETLDQIVVAHNFGDVSYGSVQSQNVPSLASRAKHILGIRRPECVAYDILFGCPGWVQALIQSDAYFKAGMARRVLLIGSETLSRVVDSSDRDSMIFADGAGACILEYRESDKANGILSSCAQTHSMDEFEYINMGPSYNAANGSEALYIKMKGRKVYEYALKNVPAAIKQCIDMAGVPIENVKKILIHQANEKMDEEIINRLYSLYGIKTAPEGVMPMCIQWLGNSSVATVPTLYHLIRKGEMPGHTISDGDVIVFASVGAGMNINAVCYKV